MNLVTTADGEPHAVLIRAIEPIRGIDLMARRRRKPPDSRELTNGPGKLTNALAITGADYGRDLCGGRLYLEHSELPVGTNRPLAEDQRRLRRPLGIKAMALLRTRQPLRLGRAARLAGGSILHAASGRDTTITFLNVATTTGYSRRISATCAGATVGEMITTRGASLSDPVKRESNYLHADPAAPPECSS